MRSHTKSRACGSSPVVGSSRNSTSGWCIRARAIMIRCDWPPEKKSTLSSARSSSPNSSSSALARRVRSAAGMPKYAAWNSRICRADSARSRLERCGTVASRRFAATGSRTTSMPATIASPLVGRTRVVSTPTVVVLPAPLGPEQPEHLALAHREAHPVDRVGRAASGTA